MVRWLKNSRLGPLEAHLLSLLRRRESATVRELLAESGVAAYTTVMTTLDRLYRKGLVERAADGRNRAYRYRPKQTEEDFYRTMVGAELQRMLNSAVNASAPVSFLVNTVTEHDAALLDELTRAVNRKRRELRRKDKP